MRNFFNFMIEQNTWEQWLEFAGIIIAAGFIGNILLLIEKKFLRKRTEKSTTKVDDLLLNVLQMPFVCGLVLFGIYVAIQVLALPEYVYPVISMAFKVLILLDVAWIVNRLIKNVLNDFLLPYATNNKVANLDVNII